MREYFHKLKELVLTEPDDMAQQRRDVRTKLVASGFLCFISIILTVMNIINGYTFMACTTGVLIAGFLAAAVLVGRFKWLKAGDVLMAVMCALIFSVYAVEGENEGFASLWILLMPVLGMSILSPLVGICVSVYFQIFLIVVFYTPLRNLLPAVPGYTATFMTRFPVLYFCDMGVAILLSLQKQYYYLKAKRQAHQDSLTGLSNRNLYIEFMERISERPLDKNLSVVCLDVNGLKRANDQHGHEAGDELLIAAGNLMRQCFTGASLLCRTGGDEFCVITTRSASTLEKQVNAFRSMSEAWEGKFSKGLTVSIGCASLNDNRGASISDLMRVADQELYADKEAYYKRTGLERRRT